MKLVKGVEGKKPLVSVIITTYNRERYIAEAIESVLCSSYNNFELIICDDASTDKTIEIARSYEEKDERIKVYVNEVNIKQFQNRNKSAEFAQGKYIKFLDSDDVIYASGLETMVFAMEKFPDAGIGFSFFRYDGDQLLPYLVPSHEAYKEHYFKGGFLYEGPTGAIYRKDFFEQIGKFDLHFKVAADYAFNLKAALYKPVVIFQRDLCWWRRHELQEFQLENNSYKYLNYNISNFYLNHSDCPLTKEEAGVALNNIKKVTSRKIIKNFIILNFHESKNIYINSNLKTKDIIFSLWPSGLTSKISILKKMFL